MFYSDKPISSNNEDKLNRKGFAKLLAHTLVHLDSKLGYLESGDVAKPLLST